MPNLTSTLQNYYDDLTTHPVVIEFDAPLVVLGDLHGNALKLLHFLLKLGIISWDNESHGPTLYNNFRKIYELNSFNEQDYINAKEIISHLVLNPKSPKALFLGDELCDRGNNDLLTLLLFNFLHTSNFNYSVCYSNHFNYFYSYIYEPILANKTPRDKYYSSYPLIMAVKNNWLKPLDLKHLVATHCKHMTLIFATISENTFYQYTHAPTSNLIAEFCAKKMNLLYFDNDEEVLAWTIEYINKKFQNYLNTHHTKYFNAEIILDISNREIVAEEDYPFEMLIWNRRYEHLNRQQTHSNGFRLGFVHGHDLQDKESKSSNHIFSLDSLFGRSAYKTFNPILLQHCEPLSQEKFIAIEERIAQSISDDLDTLNNEEVSMKHLEKLEHYQALIHYPLYQNLKEKLYNLSQKCYSFLISTTNNLIYSITSYREYKSLIASLANLIHYFDYVKSPAPELGEIYGALKLKEREILTLENKKSSALEEVISLKTFSSDLITASINEIESYLKDPKISLIAKIQYLQNIPTFIEKSIQDILNTSIKRYEKCDTLILRVNFINDFKKLRQVLSKYFTNVLSDEHTKILKIITDDFKAEDDAFCEISKITKFLNELDHEDHKNFTTTQKFKNLLQPVDEILNNTILKSSQKLQKIIDLNLQDKFTNEVTGILNLIMQDLSNPLTMLRSKSIESEIFLLGRYQTNPEVYKEIISKFKTQLESLKKARFAVVELKKVIERSTLNLPTTLAESILSLKTHLTINDNFSINSITLFKENWQDIVDTKMSQATNGCFQFFQNPEQRKLISSINNILTEFYNFTNHSGIDLDTGSTDAPFNNRM